MFLDFFLQNFSERQIKRKMQQKRGSRTDCSIRCGAVKKMPLGKRKLEWTCLCLFSLPIFNNFGRNTTNYNKWRDIFSNHGSSAHNCAFTNLYTGHYNNISTQPHIIFDYWRIRLSISLIYNWNLNIFVIV